ncbi:MAG TPA: hypothetical protein PKO31_04460 [Methanofastidiosum sp.]|nr:hypothetical protein [Methanofastidiosum sp.]HQQ48451.1 hypothetical protein [Methanofastidiosum sp.]
MTEKEIIGKIFPNIVAYSLAKTEIRLPEVAKGKVALITIAFVREAQEMIDSWSIPFENRFGKDSNYVYYEVPMLDRLWKLFRGAIDGGMRGGIPTEKHENVITYYGNYKEYVSYLSINNLKKGHVFLLDKQGIIRFSGIGFASEEEISEMLGLAEKL